MALEDNVQIHLPYVHSGPAAVESRLQQNLHLYRYHETRPSSKNSPRREQFYHWLGFISDCRCLGLSQPGWTALGMNGRLALTAWKEIIIKLVVQVTNSTVISIVQFSTEYCVTPSSYKFATCRARAIARPPLVSGSSQFGLGTHEEY
jgi:hypothetical protein